MNSDENQPATKRELQDLESRMELKFATKDDLEVVRTEIQELESRMTQVFDTKLENLADQIIRAFDAKAEEIVKHMAHTDDVAKNSNRISRIENHIGISEQ